MAASQLGIHLANAEAELEEVLADPRTAVPATQQRALDTCRLYRTIGLCELLMTGTAGIFRNMLRAGASHYVEFLVRDPPRLTSKLEPLWDALAAGELDVARRMAVALGTGWDRTEEYEEDHLHAMLMCRYLGGVPADRDEATLLGRFRELADSHPDIRVALWTALIERHPHDFEAALEEFLADYERRQLRLFEAGFIAPEAADTTGKINLEGLSWIRLGHLEGFALQPDHLLAPSLARPPAA